MYVTKSGIKLPICEQKEFRHSWLFKQNICYMCDINKETFKLYLKFPMLLELLKDDMMQTLEKRMNATIEDVKPFILFLNKSQVR